MYGESPVGLTLRSYAPPNVEIDVNGLTLNLFADINFTVKDKNGEIKNLFDAQFVSLYLFEYFYWWVKISIDDQKQPQKLVSAWHFLVSYLIPLLGKQFLTKENK